MLCVTLLLLTACCCLGTLGMGYLFTHSGNAAAPAQPVQPVYVPTAAPFVFEGAQACPGEDVGCWTSGPAIKKAFTFSCPSGYLCDIHFAQDNRTYVAIGPWSGMVFAWTARPEPIGETSHNAACNQAKHLGSVIKSYEVTVFGQTCPQ